MKMSKYIEHMPLYTIICDDYTELTNSYTNCGFRLPNNKFLYLYDSRIDDEKNLRRDTKYKFKVFDDDIYQEKTKSVRSLLSILMYIYPNFFCTSEVPKYDKNKTLYCIVSRQKSVVGFKFNYHIGYMTIHENYWAAYDYIQDDWITYHINDVIAWSPFTFGLGNINKFTE